MSRNHIPRSAKQFFVRALIVLCKGLLAIGRALVFFLLMLYRPMAWVFRSFCMPVVAVVYSLVRRIRRGVAYLYAWLHVRLSQLFTTKHMLHVAVVALAFLVTATNISASGITPVSNDGADGSVLGSLLRSEEDDILVEEADDMPATPSVSYLEGQALSVVGNETVDASDEGSAAIDDGQYDDTEDELANESPFVNGVQTGPESGNQDADRPATRTQIVEYTVEDGDTIGSIAQHFGLSVTSVVAANKIKGALIHPGDKLRILPVDGIAYIVKKGDTLQKVATTYKAQVDEILSYNGLADTSSMQIGMELILPGGRVPPPPPPPAPSRFASNIRSVFNPSPAVDRVGTGKLLWPVASRRITQYFRGRRHTGLDVGASIGTSIFAADDGIVEYSGWNRGGYGNMIIINHGSGLYTRYGHSSKLLVAVGQQVKRGDVIALVGSTGRSTGPHLHFEVMVGNIRNRLNPLEWIR